MDLIQKARDRFDELTKIMNAADSARQEWQELRAFLDTAEMVRKRLDPAKVTTTAQVPPALLVPPIARPPLQKDGVNQSADLADYVLQVHGPQLHLNAILDHMIEEGWQGSGNRRKDWKNLFNNLSSKKKRFRNVGGNTWKRVEGGG